MKEVVSAEIIDMIAYALTEAKPTLTFKEIDGDIWIIVNQQVFVIKVEKVNGRKI